MRIFNKRLIGKTASALLATAFGILGIVGSAQAVYVSPDGTGQVLIYPYYTAQSTDGGGAYVTAISVTNTTTTAKYVKVRIREGENSREVLDFNVFLSEYDMWTGFITQTAEGAKIATTDLSCTVPELTAAGKEFKDVAYTGTPNAATQTGGDEGGTTKARTREGYIEIFELGVMTDNSVGGQIAQITHTANGGAPTGCNTIRTAIAAGSLVQLTNPTNALYGTGTVLNVALGTDYSYDAIALADFLIPLIGLGRVLDQGLGTESPTYQNADPISTVLNNNTSTTIPSFAVSPSGAQHIITDWTNSGANAFQSAANAVSAVLMHAVVMNDYAVDDVTLSGTDWVITFPTKRNYVFYQSTAAIGGNERAVGGTVDAPFQRSFRGGSCDDISISFWDREEWENVINPVLDFSPLPTVPQPPRLCHEVNVLTFNQTNVLSSALALSLDVAPRQNGWARITFVNNPNTAPFTPRLTSLDNVANPTSISTDGTAHTYFGLPVVGFMVQDFTNNNAAPGVMATYGGNYVHKYRTDISI